MCVAVRTVLGMETTRFYKRFLSRFLPFVKNPDRTDMTHLTSKA